MALSTSTGSCEMSVKGVHLVVVVTCAVQNGIIPSTEKWWLSYLFQATMPDRKSAAAQIHPLKSSAA